MKQVLQNLSSGETSLVDVPCPAPKSGHLVIETRASLISLGTERMLVSFGKAGYISKARQQPEKVKQVLTKVKTDGLGATVEAVRAKLDAPLPMGYCNAGIVREVGAGVEGFKEGDRVASNGGHAEVVVVPKNLCARIPDGVSFEHACFTVAASIPLQGIRLLRPALGESIVVLGLGLMGLMAVQILRAHGCRVAGVDLDPAKCRLAAQMGAEVISPSEGEDVLARAHAFSGGDGVDGVLITASTQSSDPTNQAADMCRKRGRIVQVGATGLNLLRDAMYKKELSLQVSCSYGPGRYDPAYEEDGLDYPLPYVRWTEQRNFGAVLEMLRNGNLDVDPLISHRFPIDSAPDAYGVVAGGKGMGIVLEYPGSNGTEAADLGARTVDIPAVGKSGGRRISGSVGVGVIGAGAFCSRFILPALRDAGARMEIIASSQGVSGTHYGRKFGFTRSTTDLEEVFGNPSVDLVVIATQHNTHAAFAGRALEAGKAVYVEKPLCITRDELEQLTATCGRVENPYLMVGFNRRFAPHVERMVSLLEGSAAPRVVSIMVNAGALPEDHWHHDPAVGGGRMLAEGCHFIDLARYLVGHPIERVEAVRFGENDAGERCDDRIIVTLTFGDGSIASVHYLGNGDKAFPKERIEVFAGGRVLQLDNFRVLRGYGFKGFRKMGLMRQDKGHKEEFRRLIESLTSGSTAPIPLNEILESMDASFRAVEAAG